jgi:hypothetical protein
MTELRVAVVTFLCGRSLCCPLRQRARAVQEVAGLHNCDSEPSGQHIRRDDVLRSRSDDLFGKNTVETANRNVDALAADLILLDRTMTG